GNLRDRYDRVHLGDAATWTNQSMSFTRALGDMLLLAEVIAKGSLMRKESRGSHYRLDYPERDDDAFLKTTVASFENGEHVISYRDVDTSLVKPRPRTYGRVESNEPEKAAAGAS
ncbi:MAG: hypothetical protein KDA28_15650, partial [Phycisphaerales bacterium]|nr:hypothetical protein [Phycisphaerales bacterium]